MNIVTGICDASLQQYYFILFLKTIKIVIRLFIPYIKYLDLEKLS
jgi:hypothetical protein